MFTHWQILITKKKREKRKDLLISSYVSSTVTSINKKSTAEFEKTGFANPPRNAI